MEAAWKHIPPPCKFPPDPEDVSKNQWLRNWTPVTFKDAATRTYHRYQPCLLETSTKLFYVLGFDPTTNLKNLGIHNWMALPPLDFLPSGCERVIAGAAGNSLLRKIRHKTYLQAELFVLHSSRHVILLACNFEEQECFHRIVKWL